jgi:hypothetical protein
LEAARLRHATWQTLEVSNRNQDRILKWLLYVMNLQY